MEFPEAKIAPFPPYTELVNKKQTQKKSGSREASFGSKLDGAFVVQRSGTTVIIEEKDIGVQKSRNILRIGQIKIEVKLFLYPAIERLDDRIVRRRAPRGME